jgi:hypothetical protein
MKKRLAILCLLVLAAIWSVGPAAKTYSHASGNPQPLKLHASSQTAPGSIAASAEDLRNLAIRAGENCPDGYFNCDGCCVPYACMSTTQARAQ